jgi:hypothetical protein
LSTLSSRVVRVAALLLVVAVVREDLGLAQALVSRQEPITRSPLVVAVRVVQQEAATMVSRVAILYSAP